MNGSEVYSAPRRYFHWLMALMLITMIACVELHDSFPKGSTLRSLLMNVHMQIGLLVFLLVWPRLSLALRGVKPPVSPPLPPWQHTLSAATHRAMYLVMLLLPVIGMLMIQSSDKPVALLGLQLPQLIGADKLLSRTLREVHGTIGNVMIGLIAMHVAAAIWHHRIRKDNTLTRMLPARGK